MSGVLNTIKLNLLEAIAGIRKAPLGAGIFQFAQAQMWEM